MRVAKRKKAKNASCSQWSGNFSPVDNGEITLFSTEKIAKTLTFHPQEVIDVLSKATSRDGRGGMNPSQRLRTYDKYVPALLDMYFAQMEIVGASVKDRERVTENKLERSGKRWDKDEDELLIELASDNNNSLMQIAISMGRTPAAIQTRISYLVGIKKLSSEIAGRFVGTLNGEYVAGVIEGELRKD